MRRFFLNFGVGLKKREGLGTYPSLEDLEVRAGVKQYSLGYRFRDYGKLALSIVKRLEECGTISKAPETLNKVKDFYILPNLLGPSLRVGGPYTQWMIDKECPQIGVLEIQIQKRRKKVFFGTKGVLILKAALKSSNLARSLEDLVVLGVLARKIQNLSLVLQALSARKSIDCYCTRVKGKEIHQLKGKKTQIATEEIFTTLHRSYFVHCESPQVIPSAISTNSPVVISSLIYNEIYRIHHAIRTLLQLWINETVKVSAALVTADPYEVSDRMVREITRGFEKLGVLQSLRRRARYVSIPDRLLADLVRYFGQISSREASLKGETPSNQLPLSNFAEMIKEEFRILINPNDVIEFLRDSVDHNHLGIDLKTAKGYFISDYHRFTRRLETLGLATIRPDGDVMIRVE